MITFNEEQLAVIAEFVANSKLNTFLYDNPDCNAISGVDRMDYVSKANRCEEKMTKLCQHLHGLKVTAYDYGTVRTGILEIPMYRTVEGRTFIESTRINMDGSLSLWINTGGTRTTHLYNSNGITLVY